MFHFFFFLLLRTDRQRHLSPIQVVNYVWVLIFPHHENLIDDQFLLGLLLQVHLFNSNLKNKQEQLNPANTRT